MAEAYRLIYVNSKNEECDADDPDVAVQLDEAAATARGVQRRAAKASKDAQQADGQPEAPQDTAEPVDAKQMDGPAENKARKVSAGDTKGR